MVAISPLNIVQIIPFMQKYKTRFVEKSDYTLEVLEYEEYTQSKKSGCNFRSLLWLSRTANYT